MKAIKLIIFLLSVFSVQNCIAQLQQRVNEKMKLQLFFQQNADSTIMVSFDRVSLEPVRYLILSKHADTVSAFYYGLVAESQENIPLTIRRKLKQVRITASTVPVDINAYFHVKSLSLKKGASLWNEILSQKPWMLEDDKSIGEGCNGHTIYDGSGISLYLITSANVKHLYFYEPKLFLEKKCPGESERKRLLQIEGIFTNFFEPKE